MPFMDIRHLDQWGRAGSNEEGFDYNVTTRFYIPINFFTSSPHKSEFFAYILRVYRREWDGGTGRSLSLYVVPDTLASHHGNLSSCQTKITTALLCLLCLPMPLHSCSLSMHITASLYRAKEDYERNIGRL